MSATEDGNITGREITGLPLQAMERKQRNGHLH